MEVDDPAQVESFNAETEKHKVSPLAGGCGLIPYASATLAGGRLDQLLGPPRAPALRKSRQTGPSNGHLCAENTT
jgi:hypothetical protein